MTWVDTLFTAHSTTRDWTSTSTVSTSKNTCTGKMYLVLKILSKKKVQKY